MTSFWLLLKRSTRVFTTAALAPVMACQNWIRTGPLGVLLAGRLSFPHAVRTRAAAAHPATAARILMESLLVTL